jgi:hypothetical protein
MVRGCVGIKTMNKIENAGIPVPQPVKGKVQNNMEAGMQETLGRSEKAPTKSSSDRPSIDFVAAYRVLMQAYIRSIDNVESDNSDPVGQ